MDRLYANFMNNSIEVHAVLRLSWGFETILIEFLRVTTFSFVQLVRPLQKFCVWKISTKSINYFLVIDKEQGLNWNVQLGK